MRTLIAAALAGLALLVVPATSAKATTMPATTPVSAPLGATVPVTDAGKTPVTQKAGTPDFENCGCRRSYRVRYYRVRYHRVRYYRVRYAVRYWVYRY